MMNDYTPDPDQLAERLDDIVPPHKPDTSPTRESRLLEVAAKLAISEHPALTPEKLAQIEARVLDKHAKLRASGRLHRFASVQRALVVMAVMEAALLLAVFVAILPDIGQSVPGDWLYPFKRAGERIELVVSGFTQDEVTTQTGLAERRVSEVITLLGRGQLDVDLLTEAMEHLAQAQEAAAEHGSPALVEQAVQISWVLETVVEQGDPDHIQATQAARESLTSIIHSIGIEGDLPPRHSPTQTPIPANASITTTPPAPSATQ